jgi:hypothetical protein
MKKQTCLNCNKPIVGRTDKKFCSDNCRATFHYSKTSDFNRFKNEVHAIHKRNRNILAKLNPNGLCTVSRAVLEKEKFNFNYFTNLYRTKKGDVYWFCYDYGLKRLTKNNSYVLVIWQSYMEEYSCKMNDPKT